MQEIPTKDKMFDVVTAIASIHHIPTTKNRIAVIKEIKRVLKENGTAIITVWNLFQPKYKKYIWHSRLKALLSFGKYDFRDTFIPWGKYKVKRYYYAFTQNELRELLIKNGFKIIEEYKGKNFTFICKK